MCTLYGVCPKAPPSSPPLQQDLDRWSVSEVAAFVASLGVNGTRQTCPPGCLLVQLFEPDRFVKQGVAGTRLHSIIRGHERRFIALPKAENTNASVRKAHGHWLESHGLLQPGVSTEQTLAFYMRLKDALRAELPAVGKDAGSSRRRMIAVARGGGGRGSGPLKT